MAGSWSAAMVSGSVLCFSLAARKSGRKTHLKCMQYASHTFDFPAVLLEFKFPRFLPPHDEISPFLIMYLIHTFSVVSKQTDTHKHIISCGGVAAIGLCRSVTCEDHHHLPLNQRRTALPVWTARQLLARELALPPQVLPDVHADMLSVQQISDSFHIFYYIFLLFFITYNFVCLCVHLYTVQKFWGMHDNLRVYVGGHQSEISPRAPTLPGPALR